MPENIDNTLLAELRRYGRGSAIVFIGTVLSALMGLLFSIVMARSFSPEMFGLVQLVLATGTLVGGFLALGSSGAVTHFVARLRAMGKAPAIRQIILTAAGIVSIAVLPIAILFYLRPVFFPGIFFSSTFRTPSVLTATILIAVLIPYYTIVAAALRGLEKFAFLQIWDGLFKRLLWIAPLFFLPALLYVWTFPISLGLLLVLAALFLFRSVTNTPREQESVKEGRDLRKQFLIYLLPLSLASIVGQTKGELNTVLLGLFSTEVQAGYFKIALSIGKILLLTLGVTNVAFLPIASRLLALDRKADLLHLYRTITRWLWMLTVPAGVFLILFASHILHALYGREYAAAHLALILVVIGSAVNAAFGPINNLILAFGRTKAKLIIEAITFILVLGTNALLIPAFGAIGAAVSFAAGFAFWNTALYVHLRIHEGSLRAVGSFHIIYLIAVAAGMVITRWFGEKVLGIDGQPLMVLCLAVAVIPIIVIIKSFANFKDDRSLIRSLFKRKV